MDNEDTKTEIFDNEDEENDFDLSGMPKASSGEEGKDGEADGAGEGGESGESGKTGDGNSGTEGDGGDSAGEGDKGKGKEGDDKGSSSGDDSGKGGDDGAGEGGEGTDDGADNGKKPDDEGAGKEGSDEGEGKEGEASDDFFGAEFKDDSGSSEEGGNLDFGDLAGEFEIDEVESKEDFVSKVNEKIENAKQELKLDGYTADAQGIIKHLNENDGKLEDFFTNDSIAQMQSVLASPADAKVLSVRTNELIASGVSAEAAQEQAGEELEDMSTREVKDQADKIDLQAKSIINEEVGNIVGDREKVITEQKQKAEDVAKTEREHLKSFVKKQSDYAGISLTDKAKENIVREIESGEFDRVANQNPAASKFNAYMFAKFGNKIVENFGKEKSEQNRRGTNAATRKQLETLHESDSGAKGSKSGKQQGEQGSKKNFDSWGEEEIFEDSEN